jgi:hypothetical protein
MSSSTKCKWKPDYKEVSGSAGTSISMRKLGCTQALLEMRFALALDGELVLLVSCVDSWMLLSLPRIDADVLPGVSRPDLIAVCHLHFLDSSSFHQLREPPDTAAGLAQR